MFYRCMYICGVPGTGKTATVREVVKALENAGNAVPDHQVILLYTKNLQEKYKLWCLIFQFAEINGMRLADPKDAYSSLYMQLTGNQLSASAAATQLDHLFSSTKRRKSTPILLLIDEVCEKKLCFSHFLWSVECKRRCPCFIVVLLSNKKQTFVNAWIFFL